MFQNLLRDALDDCAQRLPRDRSTLAPLYTATHARKHIVAGGPAAQPSTPINAPGKGQGAGGVQDNSAFSIQRSGGKGPGVFGWQVRAPALAVWRKEATRSLSLSGVSFGGPAGGGGAQSARSSGFRLPSRIGKH